MRISFFTIPHIEKALGISLYQHQIFYLLGEGKLKKRRGSGKTTAYCIRLALSDGEPLDLRTPENYADEELLPDQIKYARVFFKSEFLRIRQQLRDYGFIVRKIIV